MPDRTVTEEASLNVSAVMLKGYNFALSSMLSVSHWDGVHLRD